MKFAATILMLINVWQPLFGTAESAYINATLPSSTTAENGTRIDFILDAFDPPTSSVYYLLLKFGYEKTGAAFNRLYNYNKITSTFTLHSPIPAEFVGRLTTSLTGSKPMISISPILFNDENYQFYFELDYATASGVPTKIDSQKYILQNIYSKPRFDEAASIQSSTGLRKGLDSTISCVARSRPVSTVTWSYNNATVNATQSSTTSTSGSIIRVTSTLRIRNSSSLADGEKVTCFASHQFSTPVNRSTILRMFRAPYEIRLTATTTNPVNGSSVTLTCSARAYPAAHFRFAYSNGTVLQDGANPNFVIPSLNYKPFPSYNVSYRCTPYNSYGDASYQEIVLNIQVSPQIRVQSSLTVIEGQDVLLTCVVVAANPMPAITWKDPRNNSLSHSNGMLLLRSVRRNQAGVYTCKASNGIGFPKTKSALINVQYGPEFRSSNTIITACRPGTVVIRCVADGNPAPFVRVVFFKKDKALGTKEALYTITDLADDTFGVYNCVANNSVKEVQTTTTLVKRDFPDPVTNVTYKATLDTIEVTWALPVCTGASGIKMIRIKHKKKDDLQWSVKNISSSDVKATIVNLDSGTEYIVQILVVDWKNRGHQALQILLSTDKANTNQSQGNSLKMNPYAIGLYTVLGVVIPLLLLLIMCNLRQRRAMIKLSDAVMKGTTEKSAGPSDDQQGYTSLRFENRAEPYATIANPYPESAEGNTNSNYMELGPSRNIDQSYTTLSKTYENINSHL
ncbi:neural cell adhesion molecule 1-like isoform X1 [Rhopilema esculentum]|uniref:neural cell adhesion molecule 1-like isoform X1 n=1 Tax=Rhopilema esculentum TaxID=499914 RepID=UPI0031D775CA|eukprot:gene7612-13424_t